MPALKSDPDVLLDGALKMLAREMRDLRRTQRQRGLKPAETNLLLKITTTLREVEADRHRPWSAKRLEKLSDAELDAALAEARAGGMS